MGEDSEASARSGLAESDDAQSTESSTDENAVGDDESNAASSEDTAVESDGDGSTDERNGSTDAADSEDGSAVDSTSESPAGASSPAPAGTADDTDREPEPREDDGSGGAGGDDEAVETVESDSDVQTIAAALDADRDSDPDSDADPTASAAETTDGGESVAGDAATVSSAEAAAAGVEVDDGFEYDPDPAPDDGFAEGPATDREMPLAEHIEEMMNRLGVVFAVAGVITLGVVSLGVTADIINYLWNAHIPGTATDQTRRPYLYGPLELILTELKVAGLAGFVVGLPVFVYETYLFMRPGLYDRERRYYLAAVPTSLVLALVGIAFSHFVVLPAIFAYFTSYTQGTALVAFGLRETFNLILLLMGYMALVFQIPLFVMLAIMMNLVTRDWLAEKRLLFWGGFLGVSFLVSPDPTGMAPIIVAATMIALFEGTLALLKWTGN